MMKMIDRDGRKGPSDEQQKRKKIGKTRSSNLDLLPYLPCRSKLQYILRTPPYLRHFHLITRLFHEMRAEEETAAADKIENSGENRFGLHVAYCTSPSAKARSLLTGIFAVFEATTD